MGVNNINIINSQDLQNLDSINNMQNWQQILHLQNLDSISNTQIPYTHLHLHTEYSLLDGANKLQDLAKRIKELGMKSVAMTDHGNMSGAIEFYKIMKKEGIKPIIGIEAYIHNRSELDNKDKNAHRFHVCLYAKNEVGYKNLMYLSSQSFIKGFYYNARINKKLLRERSEGLVCSSACLNGEVAWNLNLNPRMDRQKRDTKIARGANGYDGALEAVLEYKDIFGDDFYIEIMRHGIDDQLYIDNSLIKLSLESGVKLIATNDAHYGKKEDASMQEAAMMIAMKTNVDDPKRLKHTVAEFYIKSPKEMLELFRDIPEAVFNTQEIVDKCNLEIDLKDDKNPPTPPSFVFAKEYAKNEGLDIDSEDEYFIHKCKKGLEKKLKNIESNRHQEYKDRLDYEIKVITQMRFPGYMLIVWDFINFAKKNGIPVGPGRGSAAGSLVAYCLEITDIDPIKYDLLFERFLNPERISMPDIDTDFCQKRRNEVFNYMIEKYGKYNVAQVVTFGKMLARGVIRDVGRIYGMSVADTDKFAKLIPHKLGIRLTGYTDKNGNYVEGAFDLEPKIKYLIESNPLAKKVWDMALKLENLNRNTGKHAAALVVDSKQELWHKVPLYVQTNRIKQDDDMEYTQNNNQKRQGAILTQYSMNHLEEVDLIKFDFLGLKTLSVIKDSIQIIKDTNNLDIDLSNADVNDDRVYQTLRSGNTLGIFQLESHGMQDINRRLQPSNIYDAIALIALFRPGPMESGMTEEYIERKHGRKEISYMFDELEPILKNTYGVIVYQEQVMQIVQVIGGFSLGEADLIRRAMGKKDAKKMQESRDKFANGAMNRGFDRDKAVKLFDLIAKFAEYGFNKAHSAAYGILVFQTAYLKTYFKHEFMAAMLTSESRKIESVAKYIDEVRAMGIEILPPHVNISRTNFSVIEVGNKKKIVFGLGALKGAGEMALQSIIDNRLKDGKYKDLEDFVSRVDFAKLSKRVLEPLVKSGSLDNLGHTRASMLDNLDYICDIGRNMSKNRKEMGGGLFGAGSLRPTINLKKIAELNNSQLLEYEYECLGIYVSGHPLDEFKAEINEIKNVIKIDDLKMLEEKSRALIIGKVQKIDKKTSKNNRPYGVMMFADFSGNESITLFETQLKIIEEMDLSKPIGILGEIEKEAIVNESESSEEDMLSISYKVNIRVIDIITLQECKDVKVRIKKDKNYGKMESKIEDSTIMEEFVESNAEVLYKGKDSGIIESGGIESGIIESKFIESSFVESSEYDSVNGVVPIDLASEFKDEISCLCIVFESMIESHDIETLASLAKEHKGKNKFAIAFKQNNQAYVMQSNLSVSESLMQKLKATFPKAKVTTQELDSLFENHAIYG